MTIAWGPDSYTKAIAAYAPSGRVVALALYSRAKAIAAHAPSRQKTVRGLKITAISLVGLGFGSVALVFGEIGVAHVRTLQSALDDDRADEMAQAPAGTTDYVVIKADMAGTSAQSIKFLITKQGATAEAPQAGATTDLRIVTKQDIDRELALAKENLCSDTEYQDCDIPALLKSGFRVMTLKVPLADKKVPVHLGPVTVNKNTFDFMPELGVHTAHSQLYVQLGKYRIGTLNGVMNNRKTGADEYSLLASLRGDLFLKVRAGGQWNRDTPGAISQLNYSGSMLGFAFHADLLLEAAHITNYGVGTLHPDIKRPELPKKYDYAAGCNAFTASALGFSNLPRALRIEGIDDVGRSHNFLPPSPALGQTGDRPIGPMESLAIKLNGMSKDELHHELFGESPSQPNADDYLAAVAAKFRNVFMEQMQPRHP